MVGLANFFDWRDALVIVKPETFVGRHQRGIKICWRGKSRAPQLHSTIRVVAGCTHALVVLANLHCPNMEM
jgi:hypothetical protein